MNTAAGTRRRVLKRAICTAALLPGLALVACASVPRPDESVARAAALIRGAEQDGAGRYAQTRLRRAQDRLEEAHKAIQDDRYTEARRAAEKAQIEAELASAEARRESTRATVGELERTVEVLQEELEP
jgi:chromosome segregation ATPase